ncbi:BLOC-3 complex member HPS1 [Anopheles ziemanni]|uniref:BLOC-3 complex member HPS1 n=1 Tax=Anopheles coustani TaxID=139045 RepID=UPI002659BBC4|nr:BLOC-3 complex member HPS1 [Anopheles coustani]XP_058172777.1 BLOC-3 complex member HPS1 [Anopheles ziemanni]
MEGILVFDQTNDLIYHTFNEAMREKMIKQAFDLGLLEEETVCPTQELNSNVLIQIFSPLLASQRIMMCQFDNAYTSIQMENNLNIVFDEFLGYVFLEICTKEVDLVKRELGAFIAFIKYICGPNIYTIKNDPSKIAYLTDLIDTYRALYATNQGVLMKAIEQLLVNADVKNTVVAALQAATDRLKQDPHSQRSHSMLFVGSKFLARYSSRQAQELAAVDMVFLNLLCQMLSRRSQRRRIESQVVFLQGSVHQSHAGCVPHVVHVVQLFENVSLVLLIEHAHTALASHLYDVYFALHKLQNLQMQFDLDNLRGAFDALDTYVKHSSDSLKKVKSNNPEVDEAIRGFTVKWETLRKKYTDYFKTSDNALIVKIDSNMPMFVESVKDLFRLLCAGCATLEHGLQRVTDIADTAEDSLAEVFHFLHAKSQKNFTMGSYMEEFPGMVHFMHIDRYNGRIVAPSLDDQDPSDILKDRVWSMVDFSRTYLDKGYMSMIWKDVTFSYAYFVWFEDEHGTTLKPNEPPNHGAGLPATKPSLVAGILAGDYYQRLIETCFPRTPSSKVRCYELFLVHLGLVTSTIVLEHCRRLAVTITDLTGCIGNPIDLL